MKFLLKVLLLISFLWLAGCESVQFYHQAAVGQSKLMMMRRSTSDLISAEDTDPALRYRLELAREILTYAADQGLPSSGAYDSYVETGQPYVIWNVFAAEPYRLLLKTHCFPIAGCVSYRGFFKPEDARDYAEKMRQAGYDVYLGGVRAYSTLGWFDDPLLDTFLFSAEEQLAALLFHELAHQVAYAPGDTRFNESLATAIELHLLQSWLVTQEQAGYFELYLKFNERRQQVLALIEETRSHLRILYSSAADQATMEDEKQAIITSMKASYQVLSQDWSEPRPYEGWMQGDINNARLETVADYNGWVPAMTRYIEEHGLAGFKTEMVRLAELGYEERQVILSSWQLMVVKDS